MRWLAEDAEAADGEPKHPGAGLRTGDRQGLAGSVAVVGQSVPCCRYQQPE
jgi:hypothetical protein